MNLTSNTLLEKYLDTNCEAYRQYVQLINENKDATLKPTKERQVHHIIPRSFFKRDKLEVDNSKENKVSLRIKDHYIAHFLLKIFTENRQERCHLLRWLMNCRKIVDKNL